VANDSKSFQYSQRAQSGDRSSEQRLMPGGRNETLSGEIVDLVRRRIADDAYKAGNVDQVASAQLHIAFDAEPPQPLSDHVGRSRTSQEPEDAVALLQQELGQIGPVLPSDPGDKRSRHSPLHQDNAFTGRHIVRRR
jgi:hypothetical protein